MNHFPGKSLIFYFGGMSLFFKTGFPLKNYFSFKSESVKINSFTTRDILIKTIN